MDADAGPQAHRGPPTGTPGRHVRPGRRVRFAQLPDEDIDRHPLARAVARALRGEQDWDNRVRLAHEWQAQPLTRWLDKNVELRAQTGHGYARSVGGLEGQLAIVRRMLTDRAHLLTNSVRTQRLLDLITLQLRGLADERAYATRIADHLARPAPAGQARGAVPRQRVGVVGAPRLHA
ncbi:hypothetical protein ACNTMW_06370 [Planosporangium sp. 12N6]|uniref:hypothetical protein n=1 Tax=Planosporangium spinosum TaxID=3402278 RepID=UPI003CEB66F0